MKTPPLETNRPVSFARRMSSLRPSAIREILKTTEAPDVISFAGGLPAPELFPFEAVNAASAKVLGSDAAAALQYGVTEGFAPLREWLAAHLRDVVDLSVEASSVLITQGSQQGLDLLGKILLDPGDTVLVENPSYLGALQAFQAYEANIVGVACDDQGMRADALETALLGAADAPKFLYLIPNYQNPTGRSMSLARRHEIARIAERFGLLIVEDDPYGRLSFEGGALPCIGSLPGVRWVYLGSLSKVVAPGLRVAWLATSERSLFEKLTTAKQAADLHTGSLTQRIAYELLRAPGWLDDHVAKLRAVYSGRRDVMLAALRESFPNAAKWTTPTGGLFLWVSLPDSIDTIALLRDAARQKVAFVPGEPFWIGDAPRNTLRLNFSNATEEKIRAGIARLAGVVHAALA
ncbi:MAG TPA: PLP-dependent aminotransferase family protein [Opitutaceae bacterium]|nr:PLP-dependent aminotransferase family protein [Opitutaceae bacterium]